MAYEDDQTFVYVLHQGGASYTGSTQAIIALEKLVAGNRRQHLTEQLVRFWEHFVDIRRQLHGNQKRLHSTHFAPERSPALPCMWIMTASQELLSTSSTRDGSRREVPKMCSPQPPDNATRRPTIKEDALLPGPENPPSFPSRHCLEWWNHFKQSSKVLNRKGTNGSTPQK